jgi:hypothetical protein
VQADFPQPFDAQASYTRELFVATDGSDSSGTGGATTPYATVARALTDIRPGTRVRVRAGTYGPVGSTPNLQGTAEWPIAIVADGPVIIDAGNSGGSAWHISDPRFLVIEGFTIQNTEVHGVNIDDGGDASPAEYVALRKLHFRSIGSGGNNDCLKLSGLDHFYVSESEFEGCNRGEAIDMVGCHNGVVTGNHFHDLPSNAVGTKGGSADVLIHGNRFVNIAQRAVNAGGSTGADFFRPLDATHEATRIHVIANVFQRTTPPVTFAGCDYCLFAHNTVIEPRRWLARIVQENSSRGEGRAGQIINNVIVFNSRYMSRHYIGAAAGTSPQDFVVGSNVWYAVDNPRFRRAPIAEGIPAETASLFQVDPMLENRRAGDLRLRRGSPAADHGRAIPGGLVFDYLQRPYGMPPAVGAFRPETSE